MKLMASAQYYYGFYFTYFYGKAFLGCAEGKTFFRVG